MKQLKVEETKFSIFAPGINTPAGQKPYRTGTLQDVCQPIHSEWLKRLTDELRALKETEAQQKFKRERLPFVTFSGTFEHRSEQGLIEHSGLQCFDFDHLESDNELKNVRESLLNDPVFDTDLLFRSPRGNGLKWVTHVDLARGEHKMWYQAIRHYLAKTYDIEADPAPSSVCSACFLCADEDMVICEPLRPF